MKKPRYMQVNLKDLADIRTGHSFRGRIADDPQGDIRVVQIKDIKRRTWLSPEALPRMKWPGSGEPPLLGPDDILLPGRGEHYTAARVDGSENTVTTSQVYVIHPRTQNVTSEYLGWYLNQPAASNYILTHCTGTSIPMLSKQALGELQVPVPPLETQHKIVKLHRIWEQERALTEELLHNREQMLAGIFQRLLEQ